MAIGRDGGTGDRTGEGGGMRTIQTWHELELNGLLHGNPKEFVPFKLTPNSNLITIAHRDAEGRLYQKRGDREYRKVKIVGWNGWRLMRQYQILWEVVDRLNTGQLKIEQIPDKINSMKRWDNLEKILQ